MHRVRFFAFGHPNVMGMHATTVEITTENHLTRRGTCIIAIRASQNLRDFKKEIRDMARRPDTQIILRMLVDGVIEEIRGHGGHGLTYSDSVSMVVRKSQYECGRTLMIGADKAASDLSRDFIGRLRRPGSRLECELEYITSL